MTGVIKARDILRHPVEVVRGFGFKVFARAIWHGLRRDGVTFLSLIAA